MSGGKSPKAKGDRGEREIVKMFGGDRSYWQPGAEITQGDVLSIPYIGSAEVKRRKRFTTLYNWLADNDALFLRADRMPWLVVMPAEDLRELLDELDGYKRAQHKINSRAADSPVDVG